MTDIDFDAMFTKPRNLPSAEELEKWEREQRKEVLRAQWYASEAPTWGWARLGNADWRGRVSPQCLAAVTSWTMARGLVLLGPTGCGKSSGVLAVLAEAYRCILDGDPGEAPRFVWTDEMAIESARRESRLGSKPELLIKAETYPLVVIDEVGIGSAHGPLFDVINARYNRGLPMVVTSGLTRAQFVERYGLALWRRLTELAEVVDVHEAAH